MTDHNDEFHYCPACSGRTRHRASRERKLAPVLWCQRCFHVHMEAKAPPCEGINRAAGDRHAALHA